MKKNIIIIGGTGFIGRNFILKHHHLFNTVYCVGRNLDKFMNCKFERNVQFIFNDSESKTPFTSLIKEKTHYLIDFAYATVPKTSFDNPIKDITDNLLPAVNTLELAKELDLEKILFISTGGAIYGHAGEKLIDEIHPVNPISPYGITKLATEKYAFLYHKLYNLPIVCLRPSNAFGPFQKPFQGQGFIATAICSILQDKPLTIFGQNGTIRDYIFIDDLCMAIYSALSSTEPGEIYNIGTGVGINNISILNQLCAFAKEIGKAPIVNFKASRPFDVNYNVLDPSKFIKTTKWQNTADFDEAMRITWNWYLNNQY